MKKTSNRRTPRDAYLRQSKNSAAMHGVPSAILIDQGFDRSTRSFMDPKRRRPLEPAFDLDPEEEDIPTPSRVPDQDAMAAVVGAALDAVVSPGRPAASSTMSREIVDPKRLFERQQDVDSKGWRTRRWTISSRMWRPRNRRP
jgi:hypothetical protein